jgi:hypothetical protein
MFQPFFTVFERVLEAAPFAAVFTGFIGCSQHISSHASHPHGSSTNTTRPQSSHLYFSPFFLAKKSPSQKNTVMKELSFQKI